MDMLLGTYIHPHILVSVCVRVSVLTHMCFA